jgi:2-iminobutanoate/2-iminopropanoate deaminase
LNKEAVFTNLAGKPGGHYSQAIRYGNLLFTAGTIGRDPVSMEIVNGGVKGQIRQALKNTKAILKEAQTSLDNVIKVNAYLSDMKYFNEFNEIYKEYFNSTPPPARTTVQVGFLNGIEFEIDVIAYIPN